MKIAVIGSRETCKEVMAEMSGNVRGLSKKYPDIVWTSGGCLTGPDAIITHHAINYNLNHRIFMANLYRLKKMQDTCDRLDLTVCADYANDERYTKIVNMLHPAPEYLKDFSYELHGRNLNIINGDNLDEPVDAVYYAAKYNRDGSVKGGTGMGVAYARSLGIPVYNANDLDGTLMFLTMVNGYYNKK